MLPRPDSSSSSLPSGRLQDEVAWVQKCAEWIDHLDECRACHSSGFQAVVLKM